MSEWISVKDRRPKTTGIFFVYMPNNAEQQYGTDVYIEPQHTWASNQTYITHWMLIPTLSESEDDAEWVDNKCSACGKGIENLIDSREWYENEKPNYCPFCGTRFITEG